ncbi:MAG: cob(I)yrinic acid a,c-diamide adenosyltransferase [Anaerolineae bacterium]|nr:cob(I)yrinic acid a,c-diamide adenosyltransferase [Thermoflexales bacterium]MDW8406854.1 cob(I)yrinic acid a,c-diamide adenosyltransferase [Anaerolineae bacterium]
MSNQLYTGLGDDGYTNLLGAGRVAKYMPQPEAYGTVDEASAAIGIARAAAASDLTHDILLTAQRDLYRLMTELAATPQVAPQFRAIDAHRVRWLEEQIEAITAQIEMPREFIVPGDSLAGAYLDLARTIVRRAERVVTHLLHDGLIENPELCRYLNRLSSLLFALELQENTLAGAPVPTLAKQPNAGG